MVAVVTGNGLGLFNTSLNILGAASGSFGQGTLGQAGGKAWVNASTGNLILRFTDEQLSGQGQDLFHTRTYNTLGALNDTDGDGWRWDGERRVELSGTASSVGSSLTRTTGDGHQTIYTWNGSRYQSTDGDGAHDFIQWDAQNNEWYWTDGSSRSVERYNGSSGLLVSVRDTQGTLITYGYHNGKLTNVSDSSGQALIMIYDAAGKLTRLDTRSSANGPLTSQVYYLYDAYGRLTEVKTDLTPDDNSIVDGQYYFTRYTYDGSSFRIASVVQSDGTSASFTYELVGGEYRVKTVNDASGTTTFTYVPAQRYTRVSNALNQEWAYTYDAKGQLTYVQSPAENGQVFFTGYQYDADGNLTRITDNSGNAVSYRYDERGNRILERDPKGVTVARTFSASNQLLSEIHYSQPATWYAASATWEEPPASSAQVTRYVYDYADRLHFVVSATGSVAEYRYNANGLRVREIVYGDSRYDLAGLAADAAISESTLANWAAARDQTRSQVVGLNYDYRGNLNQRVVYAKVGTTGEPVLDGTTSLTEYVYSQHGQLLQTVTLHGMGRPVLSSTAYDGMGRVIAQMDASGTRTTVYDGQQRRIAVTTASGLVLTQVYDPLGRLIRIEESTTAGSWRGNSYYVYDAAGRLVMKEDATGVRTYTFYDALGRVAAEVDGAGSITRYGYNQKDQRVSAQDYATQVNTGNWFSGGVVTVTLAQILPASNPADRLTRLNYDQAGRLFNSIDGAGTVTSYEYDGRGQLVRQQTGERVTRTFYDADGRQTGQLDAEGYLRENVYNAAGQLQQVIRYAVATNADRRPSGSLADLRPAGASLNSWSFYDGAGRQVGSVDEQGFVTETVYNESANTTQSIRYATAYTAALSAASSFATVRDAVRNGTSQVVTTAYDGQGRVLSRTAADGSVTTFEYDAAGRLVRETSAAGTAEERSTRTRYDAFGQTIGKLLGEASGKITAGMSEAQVAAVYSQYGMTWSYDAAGRVASVTDALGNRTLSYYDNTGRLTRVINAVGEVSETKYNAFGDAVERTQLSSRLNAGTVASLGGGLQTAALDTLVAAIRNASLDSRTTQTYDTRGLLLTSIDAEGISTTNQYDQYGQLQRQIRVIAGDRKVTTAFGYNLRGERISQTRDAAGLSLTDSIAYDAFGRVIRTTDAAGFITSTDYQDNGRTVVVRDPLNQARRSEFDAFGRTLREVDALGHITQYSYDDTNRSITVTLPDGTLVSTWKTRHGETLKTIDGKGAVTQYEYNREGQLTRTVDALGQVAEKRYDKAGRLSESVDARRIVTHLDYDAANRVIQRSVDPTGLNQRTTYVFDTAGRQVKVVEFGGTTSARTTDYTYDRKGQLTQTVVDPSGLQLSTRYSYDGVGNVLRISQGTVASPEQRVTDYVYNAAGQRRFTVDALGYVSERKYDAAGNVIEEVRYANKLQGPRDPATLKNLGANRLDNVEFANGGQGIAAGWLHSVYQASVAYEINPAQPALIPKDLPAGDNVAQLYQGVRNESVDAYMDMYKSVSGIQAGHRYSFSVYTATQGATGWAFIYWVNAAGYIMGNTQPTAADQNLGEKGGGTSLADYKRLIATGVAPEGAVSAIVAIRKRNTLPGYGNSQLLAVHPQFEEVALDGSDASPWTRPLVAGADDRVTSYVYDALGRQRYSIDALGYVSERKYDAAGNVIEEVRYANKLQGPRDPATLKNLGANRLDNVEFANGGQGIAAGWLPSVYQASVAYEINPAQPALIPKDLPAGDNVAQLYQGVRNESVDAYMDMYKSVSGIQAGHRYSFSVYTATQGATGWAFIYWVNAAGYIMGNTQPTAADQNLGEKGGGTSLADYKRLIATGVAPEGAVGAIVAIRKRNTLPGYGNSQLLAVHPQFEEVALDGSDASPWTRPLVAGADDRVTSYVYDALGRQRYSIDALGYVSERKYDAAGNVIEEVRYANKLQGPRDPATLKNLGANRLDNVEFANGGQGIAAGWLHSVYQASVAYEINPAQPALIPKDLPAGDNVAQLYQGVRNESVDAYMDMYKSVSGIQAGHRYSFSVYTATQGATGWAFIYWVNAAGYIMGNTQPTAADQNLGEKGGGTSLADYKRLIATGVAPEGAVGAIVAIRKRNTLPGYGNSQLLAVHPQFEEVALDGSDASPWTRPLVAGADDRVTSYVYDALGRQRYSIDALGYVSERKYDAAGNVIEEVRYANKLQGPRDPATLKNLGANRLDNVEFANGGQGIAAGWLPSVYQASVAYEINPAQPALIPKDLPAGDNVAQLYQGVRNESVDAYMDMYKSVSGIQAGHRYSFSVYTATQGATGWAFIYWVNAAGYIMGNTQPTAADQNLGEKGGGTSLADYKRLIATGVAPEGAVGAIVAIRKRNTLPGYGNSQLLAVHPQFEEVALDGSDASPWTRPLVAGADDRVTRYTYDAVGRLKEVTDPLGYKESYTYDAAGNRTSLTNKNGQTWNYRYDQAGQLLEEITPPVWISNIDVTGLGTGQSALLVTRYGYDAFGSVISRSEGRLRASLNSDPALDNVSQARTSTFGYDALGRQVLITSPGWYNKATGQYQQNAGANTFQVTTEVTYDGLGNAVRNRVRVNNTGLAANDFVDSYKAYDVLGQVRYEVDALKGVTAYEYDGFGQAVLTRRNALPLNAITPASGYYQVSDFNATTLLVSPGNDRTIITRYDRLGRKTEVQQDMVSLYAFTGNVGTSAVKNVAPVKLYSYNAFGQAIRETLIARDINGASVMEQISTVNYYDQAGQRVGTVDALGYYTRLEYAGSGKVRRQVEYATALTGWSESSIPAPASNGKDRSVRFVYDAADRLVQTVRENATYWQQSFAPYAARATMTQVTGDVVVSRSTYDGVGNVRTLTDAQGSVTTTEYNALGQVVQVTDPARYTARKGAANPFENTVYASPVTVYGVNAFGQVVYEQRTAGTDQAGLTQVTRTLFDAAGHQVKEFDAAGSAQDFKVDVAGRRLEESRQIYTELTGWRYNNQTLRRTFTYDALGQQLSTSDWYTDNGVQKSTTNSVVYNRFGEVTAELLNGNYKARYSYNQIGNAIEQTNAQGVTSLSYDLTGKVSRSAQLGDLTTATDDRITYLRNDLLGRVLEQHLPAFEANVNVDTLNNVGRSLTTPIIRQTSDRWGNVLSRIDPRGYVTTYTYDHNNQVLSETLPVTDILRENGTSYRASLIHEKRYDALGQLIEEADRVSTDTAPLRTRQHVYNQAGELVRDIDALGASRYYIQDANGNRVGTYDPLGIVTVDGYDAMDRHTSHGIVRNGQQVTLLTNQYDQAGRLYAEINGKETVTETLVSTKQGDGSSLITGVAGNTRFTVFDERGNIVQTRNESNIQKTFVFNEANRKVAEIDGLGNSLTWTYNEGDYGRLTSRADLSKQVFNYSYNAFGQTLREVAPYYFEGQPSGSQERTYEYYGNGLLKSIRDESVNAFWGETNWSVGTYQYDQAGQRLREYSQSYYKSTLVFWIEASGQTDQRFKFDELGRLKEVKAPAGWEMVGFVPFSVATGRVDSLRYDYDEVGNRRRAYMDTSNQSGVRTVIDDWYRYDLEGRVLVGKGYQSNGRVVAGKAKGYAVSYDVAGRRLSSEEWSNSITGGERYARSTYTYNDLGQVEEARTALVTRAAGADASAAILAADPEKILFRTAYDATGNRTSQMSYTNNVATERTTYRFRGDGQLISQVVAKISGGAELKSQANYFGEAGMIDAAGNQASYRYVVYGANGVSVSYQGKYVRTFVLFDTYKEQHIEVTTNLSDQPGWNTTSFDAHGNAVGVMTYNGSILNQGFAANKEGLLTARLGTDNQRTQSYLYYQGAALANYGTLSAAQITDTLSPISEEYPGRTPGNYVVNQGDTLASIAQAVWGDSKMWYLIADANGIDPSKTLVVGDSIRIPNVVSSTHNDSTTFKPYNAGDVIGDTTPTPVFPPPPKPKKKKCNGVASVVMVVVAVVATIFTAGAALAVVAPAAGAAGGTLSAAIGAGMAAVGAGGVSAGVVAAAVTQVGALAVAGVFAGAAVVGSVASQAVGKAMGVVDNISWRQAAVAGLTAGAAQWAAPALSSVADKVGSASAGYAAQGAFSYATNYLGSKIVGLETSFSWRNLAASAVASVIAGNVYEKDGFTGSIVRGQVSAQSSAWMRDKWFGGGRPDYGQVAADAFGNSLVDYAVEQMKSTEADKRRLAEQREIAKRGTAYFDRSLALSGASPQQIQDFRNSDEAKYLVEISKVLVAANDKYGKPLEQLTLEQQEEVLASLYRPIVDMPDETAVSTTESSTSNSPGIVYLDRSEFIARPTLIQSAASVMDGGARAVNRLVDMVGGEMVAGGFITAVQFVTLGPTKTALQFAGGLLMEPARDYSTEKLSGVLQDTVFYERGDAESVRTVSDGLARFAVNSIFDTGRGVVDSAVKYSIVKGARYRGGPHKATVLPRNDGLDSHHMPDRHADPRVSASDGPAIQMDPIDHAATSSNGNKGRSGFIYRAETARIIDEGRYRDAMAREIRDARRAAAQKSGSLTKYNEAIKEMLDYARSSGQLPANPRREK